VSSLVTGAESRRDDLRHERPRARDVGLPPWAARATRAIAEAVFAHALRDGDGDGDGDGDVEAPPADRVEWVCREVDDFLARVSFRTYVIVLASLVTLVVLAPLMIRRFSGLAAMTLPDRIRALERVERSALSPALLAVKALLSVHYYEHPDAAREVGFDGACMIAPRAEVSP